MKITLKNQNELAAISQKKAESFSELMELKATQASLIDTGIKDFKEITNLNNISFGHFILIEKILTVDGIDLDKRIELLAPVILRPLTEDKLDNSDAEKENAHKERVYNESLGNISGAVKRFLDLRRTYLFKTYNGVIYATLDEEDEDEEEDSISIDSSQTAREFHTKKFFWNSMISVIANGDIFKFGDAVELMMYVVMPFLAEKRSLEIVERLEAKARK